MNKYGLVFSLLLLSTHVACSGELKPTIESKESSTTTIKPKVTPTPKSIRTTIISEPSNDLPRIGSIKELKIDNTCENSNILAYAETENYKIYVCGDEVQNLPQKLLVSNIDRDRDKSVIDDNLNSATAIS